MVQGFLRLNRFLIESLEDRNAMAYAASQNVKTRTTHMAAALFAALILFAGIAALAMRPAEAFAEPLCDENGPCYASSR